MKAIDKYLRSGATALEVEINQIQVERFSLFADELCKWNRKINLTAITSAEGIVAKHFLDSMVIVKKIALYGSLLDIGSGGGFPAIPLKIISPDVEIVSVDAVEKKIHFQRHIARLLCFEKFKAVHARAENMQSDYYGKFNIIVSRAFSDIPKFVSLALPLLAENGLIIAMKGREGRKEADESAGMLATQGVGIAEIHEFKLPIINEDRSLIVIQ